MRKSILAIVVAVSAFSGVASANLNTAIDFVDNMAATHGGNWQAAKADWMRLDAQTQKEARQYDKSQGTNWTGDFPNVAYGANNITPKGTIGHVDMPKPLPLNTHPTVAQLDKQAAEAANATHLDGNHNQEINAPHGNPEGVPVNYTNESQPGAHLDGEHHATAPAGSVATPRPGKDGVNGSNGKDGQSVTGAAGQNGSNGNDGVNGNDGSNGRDGKDGKDADMTQVNDNTANIAANRGEIISHSRAINTQGAAIERNSQRIDRNIKDIAENRKAIKRVGAMAQAASNLHFNRAENGYAVSVGEYKGSTAIAAGVQFNTSANTAVTVQASYDGDAAGASVGFHGSW